SDKAKLLISFSLAVASPAKKRCARGLPTAWWIPEKRWSRRLNLLILWPRFHKAACAPIGCRHISNGPYHWTKPGATNCVEAWLSWPPGNLQPALPASLQARE